MGYKEAASVMGKRSAKARRKLAGGQPAFRERMRALALHRHQIERERKAKETADD